MLLNFRDRTPKRTDRGVIRLLMFNILLMFELIPKFAPTKFEAGFIRVKITGS
jgi:hypothetical protein